MQRRGSFCRLEVEADVGCQENFSSRELCRVATKETQGREREVTAYSWWWWWPSWSDGARSLTEGRAYIRP